MSDDLNATVTHTPTASQTPAPDLAVETVAVPAAQVPAQEPSAIQPGSTVPVAEPSAPAASDPASVAGAAPQEPTSLLSDAGKPAEAAPVEAKPEEKKEEAKPAELPAEAAPPEPIVYELKIPEAVKLSETELKEVQELFNEGRVAPEVAQKYLDRHYTELEKATKSIRDDQWNVWNKTQDEWRDKVMTDPELGGNRLQTTLNTAGAIIEQYGSEDLRKMLGLTGAGNHPAMVRFLYNVGKALGEGRPIPAPPPVSQAVKSRADRLYGNTRPNGA